MKAAMIAALIASLISGNTDAKCRALFTMGQNFNEGSIRWVGEDAVGGMFDISCTKQVSKHTGLWAGLTHISHWNLGKPWYPEKPESAVNHVGVGWYVEW